MFVNYNFNPPSTLNPMNMGQFHVRCLSALIGVDQPKWQNRKRLNVMLQKNQLQSVFFILSFRIPIGKIQFEFIVFLTRKTISYWMFGFYCLDVHPFLVGKNQSIAFNHYPFICSSFSWRCQNLPHFHFSHRFICVCVPSVRFYLCLCQFNLVVAHEHIACGSVSIIMVNKWFLMMSELCLGKYIYMLHIAPAEKWGEKSCENLYIYKHYRCRYFISYRPPITQHTFTVYLFWGGFLRWRFTSINRFFSLSLALSLDLSN